MMRRTCPTWVRMVPLAWSLLASQAAIAEAAASPRAVVLELFTSQGCSSCPPAERVLSDLGADQSLRSEVVPLAFHVDYWNEGGWVDPFSSPGWTARQNAYVGALGADGAYTPQLVVDGRTQFNGGDRARALTEISAELAEPTRASVLVSAGRAEDGVLAVDVGAELLERPHAGRLDLLVALFENGLVTPVAGGENGGRTLRCDFVVRRLEKVLSVPSKAGARRNRRVVMKLEPSWRIDDLGVAAFLQDPGSMRIYGASVVRLGR